MELAPIVLFAYNRPEQTRTTIQALAKNHLAAESMLYVYCDGPKPGATTDELARINEVRSIVNAVSGFKLVTVIESDINCGLANSIINGVTQIVNKHGKIIVLEDDILTSVYFLQFMNDCLNIYELNEKVFSVGACNYFAEGDSFPSSFFIPIPDCWGWATWLNRWNYFEKDSAILLQSLRDNNMLKQFDLFGLYDFYDMLQKQLTGENDSWAIRWQAVCYLQNKVNIYPNPSITQHMHSTVATHAVSVNVNPALAQESINVEDLEPLVKFRIYNAMLRGYSYALIEHWLHRLLSIVKYCYVSLTQRTRIIAYLNNLKK